MHMKLRQIVCAVLASATLCTAGTALGAGTAADAAEILESEWQVVQPVSAVDGMTVSELLSGTFPQVTGGAVVTSDGERVPDSAIVCTGMQLQGAIDGVLTDGPVIIVQGDLLGRGKVTLSQLVRMASLLYRTDTADPYMKLAADLNGDGRITLSDLVRMAQLLRTPSSFDQGATDILVAALDEIRIIAGSGPLPINPQYMQACRMFTDARATGASREEAADKVRPFVAQFLPADKVESALQCMYGLEIVAPDSSWDAAMVLEALRDHQYDANAPVEPMDSWLIMESGLKDFGIAVSHNGRTWYVSWLINS